MNTLKIQISNVIERIPKKLPKNNAFINHSNRYPDAFMNANLHLKQVGEVTIEHYGPGTKPKMIIRLNGAVPYEVPIDKFPETFEIKFDPQKSVNNSLHSCSRFWICKNVWQSYQLWSSYFR